MLRRGAHSVRRHGALRLADDVAAGKTDAIREMLKNQAIDEAPMTLEASQTLYRTEAPIWAELIAGLGLEPM